MEFAVEEEDTLQFKKDKLSVHIPFILHMIVKFGGTELEEKWQSIYECITCDEKTLTFAQVHELDESIENLKNEQLVTTNIEKEIKLDEIMEPEKAQTSVPARLEHLSSTPTNLGKPLLSSDDLQELIADLTNAETTENSSMTQSVDTKSVPVEANNKLDIIDRTHESIKLPKIKDHQMARSPSSWLPSRASPSNTKKLALLSPLLLKADSDLKSYKIPKLSPSPSRKNVKEEAAKEAPYKLKTFDLFEGDKKEESFKKLINPQRRKSMYSKSMSQKKSEGDNLKVVSSQNVEKADNSRSNLELIREKKLDERTSKELRRLEENIVKDAAPLRTRRSCTMKRAITESPPPDERVSSRLRRSVPKTSPVEIPKSTTLLMKNPEPPAKRAKKDSDNMKPSISTRLTRRSHTISFEKEEIQQPEAKRLRIDRKPDFLQNKIKSLDLKSCSINLPVMTCEELKTTAQTKQRQVAMKSTNPLPKGALLGLITKRKKNPFPLSNKIIRKGKALVWKKAALKTKLILETKDKSDDEWEDVDDDEEKEIDKTLPFQYQKILNIAFSRVEEKILFICSIRDCGFEESNNHNFINHLETCHKDDRWNGFCKICAKVVLPEIKEKYSLFNEFLHINEHLTKKPEIDEVYKDPVSIDKKKLVPIVPEEKTLNRNSSDSNQNIKKIDAVLETLLSDSPSKEKENNFQDFAQQSSTIISTAPKATVTQTKVFGNNIIGRVIPMSQLKNMKITIAPSLLAKSKKIILLPNQPLPKGQPCSLPTTAKPTTANESILKKLVIEKSCFNNEKPEVKETNLRKQSDFIKQSSKAEDRNVSKFFVRNETKIAIPPAGASSFQQLTTQNNMFVDDQFDSRFHEEVLRPWLNKITKKSKNPTSTFLSPHVLASTFKCLANDCSFYTADEVTFQLHISYHERFTPKDKENFQSCSYCNFVASETSEKLVEHIKNVHKYDKFQCTHCFYRSCVDFNVLTHQNMYHKMKPRMVVELPLEPNRDFNKELEYVKMKRKEFVVAMKCSFCTLSFFVFSNYWAHIQSHQYPKNSKCAKCNQQTTKSTLLKHIIDCHLLGIFQCVYCRFGTNTFQKISNHIANNHPSKLPLYCQRSTLPRIYQIKDQEPSSETVDSLMLKNINQKVGPNLMKKITPDILRLNNAHDVGQLGRNLCVRAKNAVPLELPSKQAIKPMNGSVMKTNASTNATSSYAIRDQKLSQSLVNVSGNRNQSIAESSKSINTTHQSSSNVDSESAESSNLATGLQIHCVFSVSEADFKNI